MTYSQDMIQFTNLSALLNKYPKMIEKIKENYLLLLTELTDTQMIDTKLFLENVDKILQFGTIVIGYLGNPIGDDFDIVASGTIIIEPKLIRGGRSVGHIEDIVVSKNMRGYGLCKRILTMLKDVAKRNDCYKVILDCTEDVKEVYEKCGFGVKGLQMAEYFI